MNDTDEKSQSLSGAYFTFSIVFGLGIAIAIAVAGYSQWAVIPTVLLGALAQTVFRIVKRIWKNSVLEAQSPSSTDQTDPVQGAKFTVLIYLAMIVVSLFWYYIGWFVKWLLD